MHRLIDYLAIHNLTDKSPAGHNYTPIYDFYLRQIQVRKMVEIGIAEGGSLRMWSDLFPGAEIWGLEINEQSLINKDKIHSIKCDQGNEADLHAAMQTIRSNVDFFVDDGSHQVEHQFLSAVTLAPYLRAGGLYFIEDVQNDTQTDLLSRLKKELGYKFQMSMIETGDPTGDSRLIILEKRPE